MNLLEFCLQLERLDIRSVTSWKQYETVRAITISGYRFRALWLGEIKTKTKQIWPRGAGNKKKLISFFFCGGHVVMR